MDRLTVAQRSDLMARIKSKGSTPVMIVRSTLHRLDYRFRLHKGDLPGMPDLAFVGRKKLVFVHGCFWHAHSCSRGRSIPKTNSEFWINKIAKNRLRDKSQIIELRRRGWKSLVIWECEISNGTWLAKTLRFLDH